MWNEGCAFMLGEMPAGFDFATSEKENVVNGEEQRKEADNKTEKSVSNE